MIPQTTTVRKTSNSYNIFILVLTVLSLAVLVVMLLPLSEATIQLLSFYDTLICVIFLIDFCLNLIGASKKSDYLIGQRGWLDLIGSIPSLGFLSISGRYVGLFRLARLSRFGRIARLLRGENKKALVKDVLDHRSQYALFITVFTAILVLTIASVLVLQFESQSPNANITSGWDALWYSMVTITTVGYGDRYPVTVLGRITAIFIMVTGVGIIGALASILASLLVGSSASAEEEQTSPEVPISSLKLELTAMKEELVVMHQMLENMGTKDITK